MDVYCEAQQPKMGLMLIQGDRAKTGGMPD